MAAIPDVATTIRDGALGVTEPTDASTAALGTCSSGTINTVYAFTDPQSVVDTLGTGKLVEALALRLTESGGVVYAVRVDNTSAPGTAGAVTKVGTGASVMTVTGAPLDDYAVVVTIVVGGANPASGVVTFKYTLDGGDVTSAEIALPTSGVYAVPNTGMTLNFTAASLVAGDTYSFSTVAPGYNTTELTTAWNALVADPRTWRFAHVVGSAASAAGQATVATTLGGLLTTAEGNYRFAWGLLDGPDLGDGTAGDAAMITAFAAVANPRLALAAGHCELVSVLTGRVHRRSAAWPYAARRAGVPISEDAARVASGPVSSQITKLHRDEQIHRGLDAARFVTLRTIVGKQGFFVTNGRMLATSGSDFGFVQHREMMDVACTIGRAQLVDAIAEGLRVNAATAPSNPGAVDERDARAIEARVNGVLRAALKAPNHVSDVTVSLNRTDNIISTNTLRAKTRITPKAYARAITHDIGYTNPALVIGD